MIRLVTAYKVWRPWAPYSRSPGVNDLGLFSKSEEALKCIDKNTIHGMHPPRMDEVPALEIDGRVFLLGQEAQGEFKTGIEFR